MSALRRPSATFAFSHPAHIIAFAFGAGLSPKAPGTVGTLAAWAVGSVFLRHFSPLALASCSVPLFFLGVWACGATGRHLGVPDHGAIVWDEVVAFLFVLSVIPVELHWQAAAFVLFRAFDIAKPPPIRAFERRWQNGLGVMFDDLLAAAYSLLVLALLKRVLA